MLNPDIPIKNTAADSLKRAGFAEQLAKAILSYKQKASFNIGLYGEWGSGKTSIINMVEEKLESLTESSSNKPIVLRFNPWLFSDHTQLISQFFMQLSSEFNINKSIKYSSKIATSLENFGGAIEFATLITKISAIGPIATIMAKFIPNAGKSLNRNIENKNNIQDRKNKVVKYLEKSESKVIIIIDDIDRLSNKEIRVVFQLIKSIADFPNTIYILAFDYEIVSRALTKVHDSDGSKYLEKIIQMPFQIPSINKQQIASIFSKNLESIWGEIDESTFNHKRWISLFQKGVTPLLSNIRDANRLNNTLVLNHALLAEEVDLIDLLGITTIKVFAPNVYKELPLYCNIICGSTKYIDAKIQKSLEFFYENITQKLSDDTKEPIIELLCHMFPRIAHIAKNDALDLHYSIESQILGNIYRAEYFDRYFSLSLEESLSLKDAESMILYMEEGQIKDALIRLNSDQQINLFFDYLCSFFKSHKKTNNYKERLRPLLIQIAALWDQYIILPFAIPVKWKIYEAVDSILWVIDDKNERYQLLKEVFTNESISLIPKIDILINYEKYHNRFLKNELKQHVPDHKQIFDLSHVLEYENICTDSINDYLKNPDQIVKKELFAIFRFVDRCDNSDIKDLYKNTISHLQETDLGLSKVISSFIEHGFGDDGLVIFDTWIVRYSVINQNISIESASIKMKEFVKTPDFYTLDLETREDVIAFLVFSETADKTMRVNINRQQLEEYTKKHNIN